VGWESLVLQEGQLRPVPVGIIAREILRLIVKERGARIVLRVVVPINHHVKLMTAFLEQVMHVIGMRRQVGVYLVARICRVVMEVGMGMGMGIRGRQI